MGIVHWFLGVLSGALFSVWPMCLKKSGVEPNVGATLFSFFAFVTVAMLTISYNGVGTFRTSAEKMSPFSCSIIIFAAICSGAGIFFFNRAAGTMEKESIPILATVMIVTQVVAQALLLFYFLGFDYKKSLAFVGISVCVYIISRP